MASTSDVSSQTRAVEQFISITGANDETARNILEACNWNLELAINMHVDANEGADFIEEIPPPNPSNSTAREQNEAVASERCQVSGDDDVRPPIPPVRQVLVEDYPSASYTNHHPRRTNSIFDNFRDFEAESRWLQDQVVNSDQQNMAQPSKRRTLEDLFRPPLDLMCRGTLEMAREEGQKNDKWLMVNIQNQKEFSCQVLNRDVWSHPAIKSIITEHFIFWQNYHDSSEGQRFMQFYNVNEFPYVCILDPRTGEQLKSCNSTDPVTFCDVITEFLQEHPSPSGSGTSGHNAKQQQKTLYDESEEMQIKAAIAESLKEGVKPKQPVNQYINDDDSDNDAFDNDSDNEESNSCFENKISNVQSAQNFKENSSKSGKQAKVDEDWRLYLGPDDGKKIELVVRYPDGDKENITFPVDSKLKALLLYLSSKGYNMNNFDLVTNFPKRNLSEISDDVTLEFAGIHTRETLYVQRKQNSF